MLVSRPVSSLTYENLFIPTTKSLFRVRKLKVFRYVETDGVEEGTSGVTIRRHIDEKVSAENFYEALRDRAQRLHHR